MPTRSRRPRLCAYCPEPGADACIGTQRNEDGGAHIYAHRTCAADRGVPPLYVFTDEQPTGVPR
jgi:hypothetical protein